MKTSDEPTLGQLLSGLASDVAGLFRTEVQLAKAEATEGLTDALGAGKSLAIGGILAIAALGVLLAGIVALVAALLVQAGMSAVFANALAAAIVGVVVGGLAWSFIQAGIAAFESKRILMDRTTRSLAREPIS